ncbi:MAG: lipopolysaccharide transport periplasmic protein LptA [Pseudomonadales bacterium]|nr:lipopolysaccharide transport periplasmic protein LptA [Pseudomonadota bacterium]
MNSFVLWSISILLIIGSNDVHADSNRSAPLPITIQADRATVNETLGKSEYFGNVIISQGDLEITAEQVILLSEDKTLVSISAIGDDQAPAKFQRAAFGSRPKIAASADDIQYLVSSETLTLMGKALLEQGEDRYQGNLLSYNLQQGLFKVENDGSSTGRINLTINPKP